MSLSYSVEPGFTKALRVFLEKLPTTEKEEGFLQFQRQKSKGFHLPAPHFLHSKQPHQQVWFLVFLFFAKLGIWCVVFLSQTLLWFFCSRCSVLLCFEQKDCACPLSLPCFIVWIACIVAAAFFFLDLTSRLYAFSLFFSFVGLLL